MIYIFLVFSGLLFILNPTGLSADDSPRFRFDDRQQKYHTRCGLDVLFEQDLGKIIDRNILLFCDHSARDSYGRHAIDLMQENISGGQLLTYVVTANGWGKYWQDSLLLQLDDPAVRYINDGSLTFKRSDLQDIDIIVFDMQITGLSTDPVLKYLKVVMRLADIMKIPLVIPNRPRFSVEEMPWGPVHPDLYGLPWIHTLTLGECAEYLASRGQMNRPRLLHVIDAVFKDKDVIYSDLKYLFHPRNEQLEIVSDVPYYPYRFLLSISSMNISIDASFNRPVLWASWLDAQWLKKRLADDAPEFEGLQIMPADSTGKVQGFVLPMNGPVPDRRTFFAIIRAARASYPRNMYFDRRAFEHYFGNREFYDLLTLPAPLPTILYYWERELREFRLAVGESGLVH